MVHHRCIMHNAFNVHVLNQDFILPLVAQYQTIQNAKSVLARVPVP